MRYGAMLWGNVKRLRQVQSDWNQANTTQPDFIKNKPDLADVATSGSYNDLSDKPTLAAAFTDLTDVIPEDYIGKDLQVPMVNEALGKLDLTETEELEVIDAKFTLLADCPSAYTGYEGYLVRVKLDGTGLEFVAP